jgi:hypothetical protein
MNNSDIIKAYDRTVSGFSRRLPFHDQLTELAHHYRRVGMGDVAIGYVALAVSMRPRDPDLLGLLGAMFGDWGKYEPAIACLQAALEAGGSSQQIGDVLEFCVERIKQQGYDGDLQALHYDATNYFVGRHGGEHDGDGSLVLWLAPFAGRADTVTSNLLNTFSDLLDADVIVMNARAFGDEFQIPPDNFLYCLAIDLSPDVIFYLNPSLTRSVTNPRLETIAWMRRLTGGALVAICLDLAKPFYRNAITLLAGECDLVVTTDRAADAELTARANGEVMLGWHVVDTSAFTPRGQERDIEVSFVGKFDGHYEYREPFLAYLADNGVELYLAGSSTGRFLSNDDYADVMRRSRVALNFSGFELISLWDAHPLTERPHYVDSERHHLKARVFEIMESEALLFESENSVITEWFQPGVHYVPFSDEADLLKKVRYYLANEDERAKIAAAGRRLAMEKYTAGEFWRGVFDTLNASDRFSRLPSWRGARGA